jgi:glutamine synthetase
VSASVELSTAVSAAGAPAAAERYVLMGIPDLQGSIRGKALRPDAFDTAMREGAAMTDLMLALDPADEPIDTYTTIGIRAGAGDLLVQPDLETLRELAWLPGWQVCLATPRWRDGSACELACREVLRRALDQMAAVGYEVRAAFEYELRLRDANDRPLSTGISYSVGEISRLDRFVSTLRPALEGLGVELTAVHTEAGPGLIELNLAPASGLRAADDATYLKLAVKEVAFALDLRASFMAKPVAGEEGSSGHIHISCWADGENAFADPSGGEALGPVAGAALAGMLDHLAAGSLALNPTVNSYKRLVPGWFAPVNASWGTENRSTALRVILSAESPGRCRIECRRPGADANPYLALAVLVAAAADGIRRGGTPPAPIEGDAAEHFDVPPLPDSLGGALDAWRSDAILREALGKGFAEYYAISREWELRAWQRTVTEWERDRYERAV